jgi:hypothetical protein
LIAAQPSGIKTFSSLFGTDPLRIRADAPGFLTSNSTNGILIYYRRKRVTTRQNNAGDRAMNYPLLPVDAAAYAWQVSCCLATLLFAMFSWMIGPR